MYKNISDIVRKSITNIRDKKSMSCSYYKELFYYLTTFLKYFKRWIFVKKNNLKKCIKVFLATSY